MVITDFNLDLPCLGVLESVPKRLGSNLVDLITKDGMQITRLPSPPLECCRWVGGESVASSSPRVLMARARSLLWTVEVRNPAPDPELR